jgi:hypothetical protein
MTKRVHSFPFASAAALCLVLLQLVSALHFSLVPHRFGSGLRGLVHFHRAQAAEPGVARASRATQPARNRQALVSDIAACAPDACPLGFTGALSRPVPSSQLSSLIWLPAAREHSSRKRINSDRARALLSAPKTSPPASV